MCPAAVRRRRAASVSVKDDCRALDCLLSNAAPNTQHQRTPHPTPTNAVLAPEILDQATTHSPRLRRTCPLKRAFTGVVILLCHVGIRMRAAVPNEGKGAAAGPAASKHSKQEGRSEIVNALRPQL